MRRTPKRPRVMTEVLNDLLGIPATGSNYTSAWCGHERKLMDYFDALDRNTLENPHYDQGYAMTWATEDREIKIAAGETVPPSPIEIEARKRQKLANLDESDRKIRAEEQYEICLAQARQMVKEADELALNNKTSNVLVSHELAQGGGKIDCQGLICSYLPNFFSRKGSGRQSLVARAIRLEYNKKSF